MDNSLSLSNSFTLIVEQEIFALEKIPSLVSKNWQVFSIGKELSEFLIREAESDRTKTAIKWLENTITAKAPGPVVCTDIDLLFHPSLSLDPLVLFRQISRFTKLIVLWPGEFKDGVLSYAQPEHHHYRFWRNLEGIEIKGVHDALQ